MAKTPTMKAIINIETSTKGTKEAIGQLTDVEKKVDKLDGENVNVNVKTSDDASNLNNLKARLEEINSTLSEKQTLLNETQSKIESQANAEIAARKRVQDAYAKYNENYNKTNAKKFASEYKYYSDTFGSTEKLGYSDDIGDISASTIADEYKGVLSDFEITNEQLEQAKKKIVKSNKDLVTYSSEDITKFKATIDQFEADIKTLTQEKESLIKEINSLESKKVHGTGGATTPGNGKTTTSQTESDTKPGGGGESPVVPDDGSGEPVKVKVVPTTESVQALYTTIENHGVANIKVAPETDSIATLKKQIETSLSGLKVNLTGSNKSDIDTNQTGNVDLADSVGGISGIQSSINELKENVYGVDAAFETLTNHIVGDSVTQIEAIDKIIKSVNDLQTSLIESGVKSAGELANFQKEFTELKAQQDALKKSQEEFNKKQEEARKKQLGTSELSDTEMIDARNKITAAAEQTKNFDLSSIKFDKNGFMTIKAVIDETVDSITVAEYKIEDFNKAVTASGKLSRKHLSANTVGISTQDKSDKQIIDSYTKQFEEAASKTKNFSFDAGSLKVDSSGMITFTRTVQDAQGEVKKLQYQVQSLSNVTTKAGSIRQDFIKNGGTDITYNDEAIKLNEEYAKAIESRRKIQESGTINTDSGLQREIAAIEKEIELENQLNAIKDKTSLSDEEKLNMQNRINEAKTKELTLYDATKERQSTIDKAQLNYDKISGINASDYVNLDTVIGGQVVNVRNRILELQATATTVMDAIRAGAFDSKEGFDQAVLSLNNLKTALNEVAAVSNKEVNKKGELLGSFGITGNLGDISQSDLRNQIKKVLLQQNQMVKDINITKGGTAATANVINDGQIKQVTISLEQYQNALDQTAVKVRGLSGAEKEYMTFSKSWVSGLKSKVKSLTQYITGLDVVMRAWMEVKEGFEFVKEMDTTLTTIYQTMDITRAGLDELGSGAIQLGKNLGTAGDQVMDAVDIYAAYGETVDSILGKASPTVMLANAAQSDVATASDQIQGVVQQYEELNGQEEKVVNAYEKLAANVQIDFPKGIQTIAEGVQIAGSVAEEAGLSFEEFGASVAKIAETTRQEGSKIGNAINCCGFNGIIHKPFQKILTNGYSVML